MNTSSIALVQDAVARNSAAVISLPSAGMLRNHKSRLLAEHDGGFLVETIPADAPLIRELIATHQKCGIAFKSEHQKVIFSTTIRAELPKFQINTDMALDVLLLEMPTEIKAMQRRANYRVRVPEDSGIMLHVWRMGPRARVTDRPMASAQLNVQLRDISTGGLGVRFLAKDDQPPKVSVEDRLRVSLEFNDQKLVIEGQMRTPTAQSDTSISSGIRFRAAGDDLSFRQAVQMLTRIVGELQREEVRRFRLGLIQPAA